MATESNPKSRREFMIQGARATAGIAASGMIASEASALTAPAIGAGIQGANDRINLAVVGIRSRGSALMTGFARLPGVHIRTIVDVDENLFAPTIAKLDGIQDTPPGTEYDLRHMLEDSDVDAVLIAAPNHWHALASIWSIQAGKHVYVEKPSCHNIFEGGKIVEAQEKYGQIVAVGTQNRSLRNVRNAMKFLHDGGIGEVYMAKGLCFKPRDSIGRFPDSAIPAGVHYDIWLGPAPDRPFNENRFHYNWHWHWDYGNGDIGNQGPHQWDIARWGLGKEEQPRFIHSSGGYYAFDCAQETPNTQFAELEYADGKILQFEVRGLYTNNEDGITIGNLFYGSEGWMHVNGTTWKTYFGRNNEPGPSSDTVEEMADPMDLGGAGGGNHFGNFIAALRTGKHEDLTGPIQSSYKSDTLHHMANISYRVGRKLEYDAMRGEFKGDSEATALMTRNYRRPFVVPERV